MTTDARGAGIELRGLCKTYGDSIALDGVDLDIAPGEFMTFLGPSGSGKTTTLNMIAGFMQPDQGSIRMNGSVIDAVPPHRRNMGMVFQNYALFPHMTVSKNVSFPLEQRKVPARERKKMVAEVLEMVGLGEFGQRHPAELSGGQQQRVALARALVFKPEILLLDEPLGALDKRIRESLQLEIKRIHREAGITFVFVTHDQEEALAMSDRIAIFNHGRIVQVAAGQDLYDKPQDLFAATFVGDSNVWKGVLESASDQRHFSGEGFRLRPPTQRPENADVALIVRPECIKVLSAGTGSSHTANLIEGTVVESISLGSRERLIVDTTGGKHVIVDQLAHRGDQLVPGSSVVLSWDADNAVLVPHG